MGNSRCGAVIEVTGLVRRFGPTTALEGVDLTVEEGSVLGLLGPNGAGKTTLVRILATLLRPDAGTARVGGYDVVREAHRVRQLISSTGQYASVDDELTGRENLVMIARLLGLPRPAARRRAEELLAGFALDDVGQRAVKTYSGGMRRRLDLAASLVGRPRIIFLDEPTTGLDPVRRTQMWDSVRQQVRRGTTALLTTQYLEEADSLADEIVVLDRGSVVASGTPEQLKRRSGVQTLQVRLRHVEQLQDAARLVRDVVGIAGTEDRAAGVLNAPITDEAMMPTVVRRLDEAGINVTELALRLPSLDDVFLALTGHTATVEPRREGAAATLDDAKGAA